MGSDRDSQKLKGYYKRATYGYWQEIRGRQLSYSALSYSWATEDGNDRCTHGMSLNRWPCKITQNLSDGLRRIRSAKTTECLWIDAICINQDDPGERSAQVSMMFDIDRSARHVLVWLGNGDDDYDSHTCALARSLDGILQYVHDHGRGHGPGLHQAIEDGIEAFTRDDLHASCEWHNHSSPYHLDGTSTRLEPSALPIVAQTIREHFAERFKAKYKSASCLLVRALKAAAVVRRRYWTRRWIVQDIQALFDMNGCIFLWAGHITSATTIFTMITAFATWNGPRFHREIDFSLTRQEWRASQDPIGTAGSYRDHLLDSLTKSCVASPDASSLASDFLVIVGDLSVLIRRVMCAARHRTDLLYLLRKFAMYECSNVHDRAYSLVALDPSYALQANYSLPLAQLCLNFAKKALSRDDFRILNYACLSGDGSTERSALDLPS